MSESGAPATPFPDRPAPFPLRSRLRDETGEAHRLLDEGLARYDLTRRDDYARFLAVHARALLPMEAVLIDANPWAAWAPRGAALRADLAALGMPLPPPLPVAPPLTAAEAWGMLYVIEGSRLGGAMLARQVGPGLPVSYLGRQHGPGEWRQFLGEMETEAGSARYASLAVTGAQRAFATFAEAAALESHVA